MPLTSGLKNSAVEFCTSEKGGGGGGVKEKAPRQRLRVRSSERLAVPKESLSHERE